MSTPLNQPRRSTVRRFASVALLAWLMIAGVWMTSAQTVPVAGPVDMNDSYDDLFLDPLGDVLGVDFSVSSETTPAFGDVVGIDFGTLTDPSPGDDGRTPAFGDVLGIDFVVVDTSGERP